ENFPIRLTTFVMLTFFVANTGVVVSEFIGMQPRLAFLVFRPGLEHHVGASCCGSWLRVDHMQKWRRSFSSLLSRSLPIFLPLLWRTPIGIRLLLEPLFQLFSLMEFILAR